MEITNQSAELVKQVLENLFYTMDYNELKNCDLVIEAATELIPLKKKIFENIEQIVSDQTLITSNTSSIPADRLFSDMLKSFDEYQNFGRYILTDDIDDVTIITVRMTSIYGCFE